MPREDHVMMSGEITDVYPGGQFGIILDNDMVVKAKLCGKMRQRRIRVILGDRVDIALSPYDLSHGIIKYRHKAVKPTRTGATVNERE